MFRHKRCWVFWCASFRCSLGRFAKGLLTLDGLSLAGYQFFFGFIIPLVFLLVHCGFVKLFFPPWFISILLLITSKIILQWQLHKITLDVSSSEHQKGIDNEEKIKWVSNKYLCNIFPFFFAWYNFKILNYVSYIRKGSVYKC